MVRLGRAHKPRRPETWFLVTFGPGPNGGSDKFDHTLGLPGRPSESSIADKLRLDLQSGSYEQLFALVIGEPPTKYVLAFE